MTLLSGFWFRSRLGLVGKLVGLVVHVRRDLAQLIPMLTSVVGTEKKLAAGLKRYA